MRLNTFAKRLRSALASIPTVLLLVVAGATAADEETWIADAKGCQVSNPHVVPGESITWSGACKDGYADGHGVLQWIDPAGKPGTRVEGTFVHGVTEGADVDISSLEYRYHGMVEHGIPEGHGSMTWVKGDRYEGSWMHGKRTGSGVLTRSSGDRYEGAFVDGKWTGHGTFSSGPGQRYEGEWKDNQRSGHGVFTWADGERWEGEWKDDRPVGSNLPSRFAGFGGPNRRFDIKESRTGSYIAKPVLWNFTIPPSKPYNELTRIQQNIVKSLYEHMDSDDEPPYPVNGPLRLYQVSRKVMSRGAVGELSLVVTVDATGKAEQVTVYKTPDPEVSRLVAAVLMFETYKPAVCHGVPCKMDFPFSLKIVP